MPFQGKTVLIGVSGGIAAYKACQLVSDLVKRGADVHVLMTENGARFVAPLTFETLTGHKAVIDTFDRAFTWEVEHVSLAKKADLFAIVPATANVIAKIAHGLADDMLTTTFLAAGCKKLIAPAMNTGMYENPVTQENIALLRSRGMTIVDPAAGRLACGDVGAGKLVDPAVLLDAMEELLYEPKDLAGLRVLVTAGPTCEPLDPVRYLTNHSSGKMGYAVAKAAQLRGAQVVLVSGKTSLPVPHGVKRIDVLTAQEMHDAVMEYADECDIIVKAAAVADYRSAEVAEHKMKKSGDAPTVQLVRTPDILQEVGARKKEGQVVCGFSMETQDLLANSTKKLTKKKADMIVANSLVEEGAGFGVDTNKACLITRDGVHELPLMPKKALAHTILDALLAIRGKA